jgi:hypothetical protein
MVVLEVAEVVDTPTGMDLTQAVITTPVATPMGMKTYGLDIVVKFGTFLSLVLGDIVTGLAPSSRVTAHAKFLLFYASKSYADCVKSTVVTTVILMEEVAAMEEVMLTAIQVEEDTLMAVDMAAAVTVVEPVAIACLTLVLDFRNKTGVSSVLMVSNRTANEFLRYCQPAKIREVFLQGGSPCYW